MVIFCSGQREMVVLDSGPTAEILQVSAIRCPFEGGLVKTIKRKAVVPACDPALLRYAYECGEAAASGKMPLPSFESRPIVEIDGFGRVRTTDNPMSRFFFAISEHASEGIDQHMAISFRLISLFKVIGEMDVNSPFVRKVSGGFEIHSLMFDVAASCPINSRGCFSVGVFNKLISKLSKISEKEQ